MADAKKEIPEFRPEEDERQFWARNDSPEFIDWSLATRKELPKLKPSLQKEKIPRSAF